jgi:multicomponent Na+:H+ antiporter subunit E
VIYWAIVLSLLWTALQGRFTGANLFGGFVLGMAVLALMKPYAPAQSPARFAILKAVSLLVHFLRALVASNLRVAAACIRRNPDLHPSILHVPLEAKSDAEISALANLVTLTPGTLSLHVDDAREELYVHSLFGSEKERDATVKGVKDFERRILEVTR